jgi:hypothetical protein
VTSVFRVNLVLFQWKNLSLHFVCAIHFPLFCFSAAGSESQLKFFAFIAARFCFVATADSSSQFHLRPPLGPVSPFLC